MATYVFSSTLDAVLPFDPALDTLSFGAGHGAAGLRLVADGVDTLASYGNLTIRLTNVTPAGLAPRLAFADGSRYAWGTPDADTLVGTGENDQFDLSTGGVDRIIAGSGDDLVRMGSSLTAADVIDLGLGNDVLHLSGNYADVLLLGPGMVSGVERFVFGSGAVRLRLDAALLSRETWFDASEQGAGSQLLLDGGALAHKLNVTAGGGADTLLGGAAGDLFEGGTGNDELRGGVGNDSMEGGAGDDTLEGGAGRDVLHGGTGNDTFYVDGSDAVSDGTQFWGPSGRAIPGGGTDTVISSASHTLAHDLENLVLTGSGSFSAIGNDLDNVLHGNAGNNLLAGGWGRDTMVGGDGDDRYTVDHAGDVVIESAGATGGVDEVQASVSHTLVGNIENLRLLGSGRSGTGNFLANRIVGSWGADTLSGAAGADTLQGDTGNDTYYVDNAGDVVLESADRFEGGTDTVISTVTFSLGRYQERLTLAGGAAIGGIGNSEANVILGNAAANVIDGGAGNDVMVGGDGNDTYHVDHLEDRINESATATGGTDHVISSIGWTLGVHQENLTLTGTRATAGTGNGLANFIRGGEGNNVLHGGVAGRDTLAGGLGNDTYLVTRSDVLVVEAASGGVDLVQASISYTLGNNLENLTAQGRAAFTGTGNALANQITGGAGGDTLYGLGGNDTLEGLAGADRLQGGVGADSLRGGEGNDTLDGGAGADTLSGGGGNDVFHVDSTGDVILAGGGGGMDTVIATVSWSLGSSVSNLTLVGPAAVNGSGNGSNNLIVGTAGANVLDGKVGDDTLVGGDGNDTYVVDSEDVVVETASGGVDTLVSESSWVLQSHQENLTLAGFFDAHATGNGLANYLRGNTAANGLDGNGGRDTLAGGWGDDVYFVDADDTIIESSSGGVDLVVSTASRSLGAGQENLTLAGPEAVVGTGNSLSNLITGSMVDNRLVGGSGNDTLDGGWGQDQLTGGQGSDSFRFLGTGDSSGQDFDVITDFQRGVDLIDLTQFQAGPGEELASPLVFIGSRQFTPGDAAGQLRAAYDAASGSVMVYISIDDHSAPEFTLQVRGVTSLAAGDFFF